jgi:outer membrane protein assembly factor BamB
MGKNGVAYIFKQSDPGGIGGDVTQLNVGCNSSGGNSTSPGMVYTSCLDGPRGLALDTSVSPPTLTTKWHVTPTLPTNTPYGPPIAGQNTVWFVGFATGMLYAVSPSTGVIRQSLSIGHAHNFTTPTLAGDQLIVATDYHVQAFRHVADSTTTDTTATTTAP